LSALSKRSAQVIWTSVLARSVVSLPRSIRSLSGAQPTLIGVAHSNPASGPVVNVALAGDVVGRHAIMRQVDNRVLRLNMGFPSRASSSSISISRAIARGGDPPIWGEAVCPTLAGVTSPALPGGGFSFTAGRERPKGGDVVFCADATGRGARRCHLWRAKVGCKDGSRAVKQVWDRYEPGDPNRPTGVSALRSPSRHRREQRTCVAALRYPPRPAERS
jgi:hypothetical protein